ncbi:MAG TPA: GvpL/GvpF family gas vesicle protein [Streptosporangiaceae bacterium]|nr:GvpL/GvpF family gas vesicle protein [Streptosporangiaceae bacterium]
MAGATDTEQANEQATAVAFYVYGVVPNDVEMTEDAHGVGDPPAEVQLVRHGTVAAIVSEVGLNRPLGPQDLMSHQELLDSVVAVAPVLPMRFGAVMTDPEAVANELLAPNEGGFAAALAELEGRAQFVIKAIYIDRAVLPEIVSRNPEAASLREQIRSVDDENATRDARIRLGELVTNEIATMRDADTREAVEALSPHAEATNLREPSDERDAVHLAVLVDTARQGDLEAAVGKLAGDWAGRVTTRLLGPMAPYDFVASSSPEG